MVVMRKMNKSLVLLLLSLLGSCESMTYGVENSANIKKSVSSEVSDKLNDLSLKANLSNKKESQENSKKNNSELNKINSSNKKISKTKLALGIGIPTASGLTLLSIGAWKFGPGIVSRLKGSSTPKIEPGHENCIPNYNNVHKPSPKVDFNKLTTKKVKEYNYKTVFEDFMNAKNSIDEGKKNMSKTVLVKNSSMGLILDIGNRNYVTLNDVFYYITFSKNEYDYNADFKNFCSWLKMEFTLDVDGVFELNQLLKELSKFETKKREPYDSLPYNLRQWVFHSKNWNCMLCKVKGDEDFYGAFAKDGILLPFIIKKK